MLVITTLVYFLFILKGKEYLFTLTIYTVKLIFYKFML